VNYASLVIFGSGGDRIIPMINELMVYSLSAKQKPDRLSLGGGVRTLDEVSGVLPQGLYSTFRTYGKCSKVLGLKQHLDRLYIPAMNQNLAPTVSAEELKDQLRGLAAEFRPGEARIRVSLSLSDAQGQIYVAIEPLVQLAESIYSNGIKVVTCHAARNSPRLKTTSFIQSSQAERLVLQNSGVAEALMVRDGAILEGLTSNFYAVLYGELVTAWRRILLGVTRRHVLRVARSQGVRINYRPLRVAELQDVSEAFITSSSRGVVPVVEVDGLPIGQGRPGAMAISLRSIYDRYVLDKAEFI
jgi:branched-chain amino acid aminotransferase